MIADRVYRGASSSLHFRSTTVVDDNEAIYFSALGSSMKRYDPNVAHLYRKRLSTLENGKAIGMQPNESCDASFPGDTADPQRVCPISGRLPGIATLKPCRQCFVRVGRHCDEDLHVACRVHNAHLSPDFDETCFGPVVPVDVRARRTIHKLGQALQSALTDNMNQVRKANQLKKTLFDYRSGRLDFVGSQKMHARARRKHGRVTDGRLALVETKSAKGDLLPFPAPPTTGAGKDVVLKGGLAPTIEEVHNDADSDGYVSCRSQIDESQDEPLAAAEVKPGCVTSPQPNKKFGTPGRKRARNENEEEGTQTSSESSFADTTPGEFEGSPVPVLQDEDCQKTAIPLNDAESRYFNRPQNVSSPVSGPGATLAKIHAQAVGLMPYPPGIIWARTTTRWFAVYNEGGRKRFKTFDPKRPDFGGNAKAAFDAALQFLETKQAWGAVSKPVWGSAAKQANALETPATCEEKETTSSRKRGRPLKSVGSRSITRISSGEGDSEGHDDNKIIAKRSAASSQLSAASPGGSVAEDQDARDRWLQNKEAGEWNADPSSHSLSKYLQRAKVGFDSDIALSRMEKEVAALPLEGHEHVRWYRSKRGFYASVGSETKWFSAFQRGVFKAWSMANDWVEKRLESAEAASNARRYKPGRGKSAGRLRQTEIVDAPFTTLLPTLDSVNIPKEFELFRLSLPNKKLDTGISWDADSQTFKAIKDGNDVTAAKEFPVAKYGTVQRTYHEARQFLSTCILQVKDSQPGETNVAFAPNATSPLGPAPKTVAFSSFSGLSAAQKEELDSLHPLRPGVTWSATQNLWTVSDPGDQSKIIKTFPPSLYGSLTQAYQMASDWAERHLPSSSSLSVPRSSGGLNSGGAAGGVSSISGPVSPLQRQRWRNFSSSGHGRQNLSIARTASLPPSKSKMQENSVSNILNILNKTILQPSSSCTSRLRPTDRMALYNRPLCRSDTVQYTSVNESILSGTENFLKEELNNIGSQSSTTTGTVSGTPCSAELKSAD